MGFPRPGAGEAEGQKEAVGVSGAIDEEGVDEGGRGGADAFAGDLEAGEGGESFFEEFVDLFADEALVEERGNAQADGAEDVVGDVAGVCQLRWHGGWARPKGRRPGQRWNRNS